MLGCAELCQLILIYLLSLSFQPLMHVFARNLCEKVGIDKPILLSLALKDESLPTLRAIEELILEHKVW